MAIAAGDETAAILGFLERIGISVRLASLGQTFLPGVTIRSGALVVDEEKLTYPGDLLHEAGHIAVMTSEERTACDGDAGGDGGAEMAAIAWSYAAALEIGLEPAVVFHAGGYKSGGPAIANNFAEGRYLGVPLLQWFGMTADAAQKSAAADGVVYPRMKKWLRD